MSGPTTSIESKKILKAWSNEYVGKVTKCGWAALSLGSILVGVMIAILQHIEEIRKNGISIIDESRKRDTLKS